MSLLGKKKKVFSLERCPYFRGPLPLYVFYLCFAVGFNDTAEEWVAYSNWVYSRSFQLTGGEIEGKTVWLKCDGLDTFANVR